MNIPARWIIVLGLAALGLVGVGQWSAGRKADEERLRREAEIAATKSALETARQRSAHLEVQLGELRAAKAAATPAATAKQAPAVSLELLAARKAAVADALRSQQVRQLMALETNLRPKFEQLGFSAAQWDRYEILQLERQEQEASARRNPVTRKLAGAELESALRTASAQTVRQMQDLIGEAAFAELEEFQRSRNDPTRALMQSLVNRLMLSWAPLEQGQIDRLREAFGKHRPDGMPSPELVQAVETVLSAGQIPTWKVWLKNQESQAAAHRANKALAGAQ